MTQYSLTVYFNILRHTVLSWIYGQKRLWCKKVKIRKIQKHSAIYFDNPGQLMMTTFIYDCDQFLANYLRSFAASSYIYIQPKWLLKQCFNVKLVESCEMNLDSSKDSVMNNYFVVPLA